MEKLTLSTVSTNRDYAIYELQQMVRRGKEANESLAADIIKYGIADRLGWLQDPMKKDAEGQCAQRVLDRIDEDQSLEDIRADLADRIVRETGYIIPTNTDTQSKIYAIQSMQRVVAILEHGIKPEK